MYSQIVIKLGRIYLIVCLCNNKAKYDKIRNDIITHEENELLREGFMDTLSNIKNMHRTKEIVLNQNTLERFKFYLEKDKILHAIGKKENMSLKELNDLEFRRKRM